MRIDHTEARLAGDQKDDGADSGHSFLPAGAVLGGLEQAIKRLREAVGLPGLRPGPDVFQMVTHEGGNLLYRLDIGAQRLMNAGDISILTELTCSGAQPRSFSSPASVSTVSTLRASATAITSTRLLGGRANGNRWTQQAFREVCK